MPLFLVALLLSLSLVLGAASPLRAEQQPAPPGETSETLTGKERLGPKWTDEQRVDNCGVPPERRGTKPRPDDCGERRDRPPEVSREGP